MESPDLAHGFSLRSTPSDLQGKNLTNNSMPSCSFKEVEGTYSFWKDARGKRESSRETTKNG